MVAGFYSSKASTQETQASRYRISICLKIREWASIAAERRTVPEHAKRVSWVRSFDTRRRKPTNKGFSPKCASVMRAGGFRTFHDYIAIFNIPLSEERYILRMYYIYDKILNKG